MSKAADQKKAPQKRAAPKVKKDGQKLRARKTGGPRKKVRRQIVSRLVRVAAAAAVIGVIGSGGWLAFKHDMPTQLVDDAKWSLIASLAKIGFQVEEILVTGRSQTQQQELLAALALARGAPMFAFDPHGARARIEAMPWVRRAVVERMLPDTVMVHIEERQALALWQHQGTFTLIDETGEVILKDGLERFADLPLVVGPDAPKHAHRLIETLEQEPELAAYVKAAVRVGGRRWNVTLKNGIDVQLPEQNAADAWTRLADYERRHKVLARDIQTVDLRLPDRLIVRKSAPPTPPKRAPGSAEGTTKVGHET